MGLNGKPVGQRHGRPINVGGKPWGFLAAFLPVTFEVTVLLAGISTVIACPSDFTPALRRPARPPEPCEITADRWTARNVSETESSRAIL